MNVKPPWTYWVTPDRLLAGEYPIDPDSSKNDDALRVAALLETGVRSFVDLTEDGLWLPYVRHLPPGVSYLRSEIDDNTTPRDPQQMRQILDHIRASADAGRPVYVHCLAGIGRTATVAGCWLAEYGFPGDAALQELNRLWKASIHSDWQDAVPAMPQQREYVRLWRGPG